jgi:hypothetical protein
VSKGIENNCHELMGFSMIKAIEDLRERLGDNMVSINNN